MPSPLAVPSVFGVIALVSNVIVLGKYVIDNAKKDKSKEE